MCRSSATSCRCPDPSSCRPQRGRRALRRQEKPSRKCSTKRSCGYRKEVDHCSSRYCKTQKDLRTRDGSGPLSVRSSACDDAAASAGYFPARLAGRKWLQRPSSIPGHLVRYCAPCDWTPLSERFVMSSGPSLVQLIKKEVISIFFRQELSLMMAISGIDWGRLRLKRRAETPVADCRRKRRGHSARRGLSREPPEDTAACALARLHSDTRPNLWRTHADPCFRSNLRRLS